MDTPGCLLPGFASRAKGNPVEPIPQQFRVADRTSFANQYEKSSLKGIFGVMRVIQHALADAQDHGSMALDQGFESRPVPSVRKCFQQLPIRLLSGQRPRAGLDRGVEVWG
jgi:hypothetical protein